MGKKCRLFILFLFVLSSVYSQGLVSGKIDDSTQTPVPFATIALLKNGDSSVIKGSMTAEDGAYSLNNIGVGTYLLKVTAVGYEILFSDSFRIDSASSIILPAMQLHASHLHLSEVMVSAIRPVIEFKNGNITVNVANSPLAKGNTVFDLLYKMPGVSIDDNTITLQGKSGVVILIDGRTQQVSNEQLIALLKSMNAESVEKIEILKNPPVRYDASGTTGMIDIKTRKTHLLGMSGSVYSSYSQGIFGNLMSGLTLNYKTEKLTLFSGFDYTNYAVQSSEQLDRTIAAGPGQTVFSERNTRTESGSSFNYKVGADWNATKKNTFGFKVEGVSGSSLANGAGVNTVSGLNDMGFDHLQAIQKLPDSWMVMNDNINAEHRFDTNGTTLNFTVDYTTLSETASGYNEGHFLDISGQEVLPPNIYKSTNKNLMRLLATRLDFSKHLDSTSSFEAGLKSTVVNSGSNLLFERLDNASGKFYTDTNQTNNYAYKETTTAAYCNYRKSFKKINCQLGLRGESTSTENRNLGKNFSLDRNYQNLFPNVVMEYEKSESQSFQLNLNRRIDRPEFSDLNPFRDYHDQYSYFQGNPFLQPHYSNTIEVTHNYKETLINSLSYTRIENVMLNYTQQNDTSKIMFESIKNMDYSEAYTYSCFFQKDLTSWWALSANVVASYLTYKGDIQGKVFQTGGLYYNGYMTHTLVLPKKMKLEVNGFYRGPKYNGILVVNARWMLSLAIRKSFFHDKLDCSIGITDIFNSGSFHTATNFGNQKWDFYTTTDSRRFALSIHYNFGKLKVSVPDKSGNEEEKGRLKH